MPKTYLVEFTVTLSTCREFEADSEEMALRIARELLDNDRYREELIESWDEPHNGWGEPNDPKVLHCWENGMPECDKEEYLEFYGYEYPKE